MTIKKKLTALLFYIDKSGDITDLIVNKCPNMASARIQLMPALRAAQSLNLNPKVFSLHSDNPSNIVNLPPTSICLIGKMSANTEPLAHSMIVANLAAISRLKRMGCKIIVQYSDHLLADSNALSEFHKDIFAAADYIVYPSETLLRLTKNYLAPQCKVAVIHDPWQLKSYHPTRILIKNQTCKIVWFGSNKNIIYLINSLPSLIEKSPNNQRFEISILGLPVAHKLCEKFFQRLAIKPSNWIFRLVPWDATTQPSQLEFEIARAHLAIIPSNPNDKSKAGVSHNRLVDALRGGCISLASPMESYKELSDIALLGNDMGNLLLKALKNYDNLCDILTMHREKTLEKFNPDHNQRNWNAFFNKVLND